MATQQASAPAPAGQQYAFGVRVPYDHATAVAKTREALKAEGFGVLTEIDVQRTMREKLGHDGALPHLGRLQPDAGL